MNWENLGIAATAALLPYLKKVGDTMAKKMGEEIYSWLKGKFEKNNDDDGLLALKALENDPNSQARGHVLAEAVSNRAEGDQDGFGKELQEKLQYIQNQGGSTGLLIGSVIAGKANIAFVFGNIEGNFTQS